MTLETIERAASDATHSLSRHVLPSLSLSTHKQLEFRSEHYLSIGKRLDTDHDLFLFTTKIALAVPLYLAPLLPQVA